MGLRIALMCIAIALVLPGPARAESGYELYATCRSNSFTDQAECLNYLRGVWDGVVVAGVAEKVRFICADGSVTAGKMKQLFLSWASLHPKLLTGDSGAVVGASYAQSYPCNSRE